MRFTSQEYKIFGMARRGQCNAVTESIFFALASKIVGIGREPGKVSEDRPRVPRSN
jgi:hypothetical protein